MKKNKKEESIKECPRCGNKHSRFDKNGKHNFIPAIKVNGKVESICVTCKMKEVKAKWGI